MSGAPAPAPAVSAPARTAAPCVGFDGWAGHVLAETLRPPAILCLDERCPAAPAPPPTLGLSLWISARAATLQDVAAAMADALVQRAPWTAAKHDDIETALQEALGNAVIHGSLGIANSLRRSLAGLAEFGRAMDAGLADPVRGSAPILIHAEWTDEALVISVEDQGRGFDPAACPPPAPDQPCGRGLCTIRSLCARVAFDLGGRRITMTFIR